MRGVALIIMSLPDRETTGITKGEWTTVWGISLLVFNEDKIAESAAIYEPFPGMREALVNGA